MKTAECLKVSLVEALYDGRLGAQERASVERHLTGCTECGALAHDLDAIRAALRAPIPPATPLEHQRARVAMLERAARLPAPLRRRPPAFVALAAAMLALAAVIGFTGGRITAPSRPMTALHTPPPRLPAASETSIRPSADASFERTRSGGVEVLTLKSGTLDVSVRPLAPGERFVVKTTDAEIEVHATALRVEAERGKIRAVTVTEGAVDVRYAGFTAVIPSGGSWRATADAEAPPAAPTASPAPSVTPPSVKVVARSAPPVRERRASSPPAPPAPKPAPEEVAPPSPPPPPPAPNAEATRRRAASAEFAAAMTSIGHGDYRSGAAQLEAFTSAHASDARSDEAEYLRMIALQRAGRVDEARAVARHYLSTRPGGAHRVEVKKVSGD
jgi:ferric-dicitrate binding protein FerR (iron transport regulator)